MFRKWAHSDGENYSEEITTQNVSDETNTILKGSKLIGDINISYDLELSGEIEGNIRSDKDSDIVIKGICKGNIETREGSVTIEGELKEGNISAGSNVVISGKFSGGEIKADGKIQINGEFSGKLTANEIEIGSSSAGKGELLYRENVSIAKGAKVEVQISQTQKELKLVKSESPEKTHDVKQSVKEISQPG